MIKKLHFLFLFLLFSLVKSQCQNPQQTQLFFLSNVFYNSIIPLSGIITGLACYTENAKVQTYTFPNGALNTIPSALFNKPFKGQVVYQDFKRNGIESNFTSTEITQNNGITTVKIIGAYK
ncbi:hypothetical protein DICPUDRAFT_150750 [Dictyostelium purpureum]|uniref:Uncharacterized protein n=1 Tax=Dictyostelium purpureum TaxID=5786 RepID=F0ZH57_DICPU|nr:uncharacterized protein DICPUDRAFT_150750 [Dictyostelium purpureum]EGC36714.1 hypothetical protein DICPUDRAFT_150750 [Dictyostelium purpureum]|eukprot:XP_003286739.1 hypothetical protein DICPUDRAFT_150750 [Dictyostelium purpureum]